ncbi:hypothetical protein ALC56_05626, partial [Trachymyrmex septentrionalis]
TLYSEDDYVLVRQLQKKVGINNKLMPKYEDHLLLPVLNNNRYVLKNIPGFNISSRLYNTILSSDKLKPSIKSAIQPFESN